MDIVMASDQNYLPHMETLIVSIAENNKNIPDIKLHIFDGGLSPESRSSLLEFESRYCNLSFQFYNMTEDIISNMLGGSISKDRSLSAYARLFIPDFILSSKALYLDVDAVVLDNLSQLYELNLDGYAIAGVCDTNPEIRRRNVGVTGANIYINTGMILWNLDYCRKIQFTQQCLEFIRSRNGNVDAMDQGTINGVLSPQGLIKLIHPRYNAFTSLFQLTSNEIKKLYGWSKYYSDDEIHEARCSPVFVHFTPNMTTRPWVEHCKHPLRDEYWHYRKMTHFHTETKDPDHRSVKLKLLSVLYRNFPAVFHFIASIK